MGPCARWWEQRYPKICARKNKRDLHPAHSDFITTENLANPIVLITFHDRRDGLVESACKACQGDPRAGADWYVIPSLYFPSANLQSPTHLSVLAQRKCLTD